MTTAQRPSRANDGLRLGVVATVLAQSTTVATAFGRVLGFVVILTTLLMLAVVSVAGILATSNLMAPIVHSLGHRLAPAPHQEMPATNVPGARQIVPKVGKLLEQ